MARRWSRLGLGGGRSKHNRLLDGFDLSGLEFAGASPLECAGDEAVPLLDLGLHLLIDDTLLDGLPKVDSNLLLLGFALAFLPPIGRPIGRTVLEVVIARTTNQEKQHNDDSDDGTAATCSAKCEREKERTSGESLHPSPTQLYYRVLNEDCAIQSGFNLKIKRTTAIARWIVRDDLRVGDRIDGDDDAKSGFSGRGLHGKDADKSDGLWCVECRVGE